MRSAVSLSTAKKSSQCLLSKHYCYELEALGCKRSHHSLLLKPASKRMEQSFRQQQKHDYNHSTPPLPSLWLFISRCYSSSSSSSAIATVESSNSSAQSRRQHEPQKQSCSSNNSHPESNEVNDLQQLFNVIDTCPKKYANRYRLLRTALYKLRYEDADEAWLIYEKMMQCKVHKQLKANHYGHLLNVLKCGDPHHLPHMLTIMKNMECLKSAKSNQYPYMRHHSQILYAMARHGRVEEAYEYLQQLTKRAEDDVSRKTPYPTTNHYQSLAMALKNRLESHSFPRAENLDLNTLTRVAEMMMEAMTKHSIQLNNKTLSIMIHNLSTHIKYTSLKPTVTTTSNVNLIEEEAKKVEALLYQLLRTSDQLYAKVVAANSSSPAEKHPYNVYVYTTLLTAFAQKNDMKRAQRIFDEMLKHGIKPSEYTYGALIDGYGRLGDLNTAVDLFKVYDRKYQSPNQVILTNMLVNAIRYQNWTLAEEFERRIRKQFQIYQLDSFTKTAIHWFKTKRDVEDAQRFFDSLFEQNSRKTNRIMLHMLMEGYGKKRVKKQVTEAYALLQQSEQDACEDAEEWRSRHHLIHALFKCRDVPAAIYAFLAMRKETVPDDITLAMVIQGLVMNNQPRVAFELFKVVQDEGIEPNLRAYTSIFNGLSHLNTNINHKKRMSPASLSSLPLNSITEFERKQPANSTPPSLSNTTMPPQHTPASAAIQNSKIISSEATHLFKRLTGFRQPNIYIYTTLISCLAKIDLMEAVRVFDDMRKRQIQPTVQIYTALIQGSAAFRNKTIALMIFKHMREQQIAPNQVTWHYLLKALVRSRVDKEIIDKVAAYRDAILKQQKQQASSYS